MGSFNFDPRSANLNTELGFVVESSALARRMDQSFEKLLSHNVYKMELGEDGRLRWLERAGERTVMIPSRARAGAARGGLRLVLSSHRVAVLGTAAHLKPIASILKSNRGYRGRDGRSRGTRQSSLPRIVGSIGI